VFLNIQIGWIILKTCDQQFTLTTKKSLHITFKTDPGLQQIHYKFYSMITNRQQQSKQRQHQWHNRKVSYQPNCCTS